MIRVDAALSRTPQLDEPAAHRAVVDEDVRTSDAGVAEALIGRTYGRTRIEASGGPFRFRRRVRGDDRTSVSRVELGSTASISVELGEAVDIGTITSGGYRGTIDGVDLDPSAPFVLQRGLIESESVGLESTVVRLHRPTLEAAADLAPGTLRFAGPAPASRGAADSWLRVVRFADGMLDDDGILTSPLLLRSVLDVLSATAVTAFRLDGQPVVDQRRPAPRSLLRAVDYIHDHAGDPIDVVEIAGAAGLGVRALHSAFRRHLDTTPAAALREVRLERVRADLLAAEPGTVSVADVARRWGFAHVGRFSGTYRARYGELPSTTLRT